MKDKTRKKEGRCGDKEKRKNNRKWRTEQVEDLAKKEGGGVTNRWEEMTEKKRI